MKQRKLTFLPLLTACSLALFSPASNGAPTAAQPSGEATDQSAQENQPPDNQARKYEEAYNKGDAKTLAGLYSDDVYYVDQDGEQVKGRDAMEQLLADNFKQNPGAKLAITTEEIKQLAPDIRMSRGLATVTLTNGTTNTTRFTTTQVKKGDQWEISQLTETEAPPLNPSSRLGVLGWLVGTWQDKSQDQTVEHKVNWAGDKNFLVRTYKVKGADQSETDGWEIIGWDPIGRQIRSWIFDSNGGFGEATWATDGDDWL
ncbi:MAG: nuclear transport factor 2 family protein, partial [Verrucomicrobia bacterium]|nr:nuclear transport factor 2 family protein [Verrucomicrobiota bacterium]